MDLTAPICRRGCTTTCRARRNPTTWGTVGYRIAKAYYLQAKDKRDAVRALIQQDNPKAILAASAGPACGCRPR